MVNARAYVKQGRLVIIGLARLKVGPIPFTYHCSVPEATPEGPVDMNATHSAELEECLEKAEVEIKRKIRVGAVKVGAESLVLRARQGDQNAMAMIIGTRQKASEGVPAAKYALKVIMEYIEDHPPTETCHFGHEAKAEVSTALAKHVESDDPEQYAIGILTHIPHIEWQKGVVLLADGPIISADLIQLILVDLNDREKVLFNSGFNGQESSAKANQLGKIFRRAQELQAMRRGVFRMNPVISWELGV